MEGPDPAVPDQIDEKQGQKKCVVPSKDEGQAQHKKGQKEIPGALCIQK